MFPDEELCERFRKGEKEAFAEIVVKYENLVATICKEEFERGRSDIHLKMSTGYLNLIGEVKNEVWIRLLKRLEDTINFHNEHSLLNLIRDISKKATKNFKNESIKNRNPDLFSKSKKIKKSRYSPNNVFESMNQIQSDEEIGSLVNREYESYNEDKNFDEIYREISDSLSERQDELIKLITTQSFKNKKTTHLFLAEKLGVSERTIRNDLKKIRSLYQKFL
jgi:RNA polymerase sigma factor (sigma-70 family)